jgi:cation-transporting ATPase 13A1
LVHVGALAYVRKEAIFYSEELEESIDLDAEFKPNLLNTGIYIISLTMQIATFAINYQGRPFRESIYENKALYSGLLGVGGIAVVSALQIIPWLNSWMQLVPMPRGVRFYTSC